MLVVSSANSPKVVLGGVAVSYGRGTPVRWLSLLSRAKSPAHVSAVAKEVKRSFLWGGGFHQQPNVNYIQVLEKVHFP